MGAVNDAGRSMLIQLKHRTFVCLLVAQACAAVGLQGNKAPCTGGVGCVEIRSNGIGHCTTQPRNKAEETTGALQFSDNQKCVAKCSSGRGPDANKVCEACAAGKFADHNSRQCVAECP